MEYEKRGLEEQKSRQMENLANIFRLMKEYDDAHSIGAMMADALFAQFKDKEEDDRGVNPRDAKKLELQRRILEQEDKMEELGLSLSSETDRNVKMFTEDQVVEGQKMAIHLVDLPKFVNFLKMYDRSDFESNKIVREALSKIVQLLTDQLVDTYGRDGGAKNDKLLVNAGEILEQLRRIGFDKEIETFEIYYAQAEQDTLGAYVAMKDAQIFDAPGKNFGPADWHNDSSPDYYEKAWGKIDFAISTAAHNKNAALLVRDALKRTIANAEFAISDMKKRQNEPNLNKHYVSVFPKLIEIAEKYKQKFEALQSLETGKPTFAN